MVRLFQVSKLISQHNEQCVEEKAPLQAVSDMCNEYCPLWHKPIDQGVCKLKLGRTQHCPPARPDPKFDVASRAHLFVSRVYPAVGQSL